ncbi:hypothetical protein HanHA300_Chr16g0590721 [Helianthus annuus]|nr:hypothetical protein HanHA300_Chr16g0590721 [Helianthus annuus]KAJ0458710.1 hypothetical protein HanHA89_Chr16g0640901 [Helianthus annuus]
MNTRLFKGCFKTSPFIQDKMLLTSWSTMYQFLVYTSVCVGLGNSYVYIYLLFPYQFPLKFQIGSCISFCISHVPPFVFSNRVNDRFSSVSVQFSSVLFRCVLLPLIRLYLYY